MISNFVVERRIHIPPHMYDLPFFMKNPIKPYRSYMVKCKYDNCKIVSIKNKNITKICIKCRLKFSAALYIQKIRKNYV